MNEAEPGVAPRCLPMSAVRRIPLEHRYPI